MREVVLATRNEHKVAEVSRMLAPFRLSVVPLPRRVVGSRVASM